MLVHCSKSNKDSCDTFKTNKFYLAQAFVYTAYWFRCMENNISLKGLYVPWFWLWEWERMREETENDNCIKHYIIKD